MIAKDNTTVVAYINKPVVAGSGSVSMATVSRYSHLGQTHSGLPQCNSRWVISVKPAHHNRVESPPQSSESNIQTVGDSSSGHDCHSPQHASAPVYISSSRAMSTGDRCSVTRRAGVVDVHLSTVSPAQQSHSQAQDDVLEALSKPPYEPLREASLKHLTLKKFSSWPWIQPEDAVNFKPKC